MKYFLDTEFIEGFNKPVFGKRRHFIDLISIGIVAEDGREYYAISSEYDYKKADQWVRENVIHPLYVETVHGDQRNVERADKFHYRFGKPDIKIAEEIFRFVNPCSGEGTLNDSSWNQHLNKYKIVAAENCPIEFYAYYADYDWVLFCSLFGRMIDLPKGFPMYCRDLKQMFDETGTPKFLKPENEHNALDDAKWNRDLYRHILDHKNGIPFAR